MNILLNRPLTEKQIEGLAELAEQATLVPSPFATIEGLEYQGANYNTFDYLCITTDIGKSEVISCEALRAYFQKEEVVNEQAHYLIAALSSTNLLCSHVPTWSDMKYRVFATVISGVFHTLFKMRYNTCGLDFLNCSHGIETRYNIHEALEVVQVIGGKKPMRESLEARHVDSKDEQASYANQRVKHRFENMVLQHNLIYGTALTFESYNFLSVAWDALSDIIFRQARLAEQSDHFVSRWLSGRERFEKARRFAREGQRSLDNYAAQIVMEEMQGSITYNRDLYYTLAMALALEAMSPICERAYVIAQSLSEEKEQASAT